MKYSDWTIQFEGLVKDTVDENASSQEARLLSLKNEKLSWLGLPVWSEDSSMALSVLRLNDSSANLANPQILRFYINGQLLILDELQLVDSSRHLNYQNASQYDKYTYRIDDLGFISLTSIKYLNPENSKLLAYQVDLKTSFSAEITVESLIQNYSPINAQVKDHLLQTTVGNLSYAIAAKTFVNGNPISQDKSNKRNMLERYSQTLEANQALSIEKVIAVVTSDESDDYANLARTELEDLTYRDLLEASNRFWHKIWQASDIVLEEGLPFSAKASIQSIVRMSIFRLEERKAFSDIKTEAGEIFLRPYYLMKNPESQKDSLKSSVSSKILSKESANFDFAFLHNLWLYSHLTKDESFIDEPVIELVLKRLKACLKEMKPSHTKSGKYHFTGEKGHPIYHSIMLLWLLNFLFEIPAHAAKNKINLLKIAKKTHFTNHHFHKAKKLANSIMIENEDFSSAEYNGDLLLASFILGEKPVEDLFQKIDIETADQNEASKASSKASIENQLDQAEQVDPVDGESRAEIKISTIPILSEVYPIFNSQSQDQNQNLKEFVDLLEDHEDYALAQMAAVIQMIKIDSLGYSFGELLRKRDENSVEPFNGETEEDNQEIEAAGFAIDPKIPSLWDRLITKENYLGAEIEIEISKRLIILKSNQEAKIRVYDNDVVLKAGEYETFVLRDRKK